MSAIDENLAICKALGLDPDTTASICIRVQPDKLPSVEVVMHPRGGTLDGLCEVLRSFDLNEVSESVKRG